MLAYGNSPDGLPHPQAGEAASAMSPSTPTDSPADPHSCATSERGGSAVTFPQGSIRRGLNGGGKGESWEPKFWGPKRAQQDFFHINFGFSDCGPLGLGGTSPPPAVYGHSNASLPFPFRDGVKKNPTVLLSARAPALDLTSSLRGDFLTPILPQPANPHSPAPRFHRSRLQKAVWVCGRSPFVVVALVVARNLSPSGKLGLSPVS